MKASMGCIVRPYLDRKKRELLKHYLDELHSNFNNDINDGWGCRSGGRAFIYQPGAWVQPRIEK
jgi:hypothetical protein